MSEPPVAAIDCGTNTIKLFIGSPPDALVREARMVRLGQGVDATGRLHDDALARAFAALDDYAALVREHEVPPGRIRFCATSATRDSSNADVFRAGVVERLGVEPEVLSGDEEAALAFAGAMSGLPDDVATPVLVVDVGGGSTEVVLGDRAGVVAARSMDVGSVRLHERHVRHDPPTADELAAIAADVDAALDGCGVPLADAATVVGIAGTSTQLAALALGLPDYDRDHIHGTVHDLATVRGTIDHVVGLTVADRRALPSMHPGRADVVDAGFVIIRQVLARAGADRLTVCETDILDGIAASIR
ncbi:Ppx/GppA phosphatase family protein [Nocardioides aestuarii]|uniref:Exopolyphosphatase n=1 Tax=Nocardioides aestuarii TaxID=252231 RepID=A0ABW4TMN2_9ACTN